MVRERERERERDRERRYKIRGTVEQTVRERWDSTPQREREWFKVRQE